MSYLLRALMSTWSYRGMVRAISERDLRARYTGSVLGPLWLILQPLAMILIYTLVFSQVMQARLPGTQSGVFGYSIFICAGLISWGLFTEISQRTKGVFLEHANLIKKVYFPKLVLLVPIVVVACFNFLVLTALYFVFLLVIDAWPGWAVLGAIPVIATLVAVALGLGLLAGVLNVFMRDVGQMIDICLQLLFWATPIVYPLAILPEPIRAVIAWNPMVAPITQLQQIFLAGQWPDYAALAYPLALAAVLGVLALWCYRRLFSEMLDYL